MAPSYEPLPSADSWAPPRQINPERWQTCLCLSVCVALRCTNSAPPVLHSNLLLSYFIQFNATSSSSSTTSNSTMRCAFGGTVCRSPLPRLPLSANKVCFIVQQTFSQMCIKKSSNPQMWNLLRIICDVSFVQNCTAPDNLSL